MRAARAYGNLGRQTSVMVSDPVGLVMLLYEKLIERINEAKSGFAARDVEARSAAISKAIELIELGLISSLDESKGGEVAKRLRIHYQIWLATLLQANMEASAALLDQVEREVRTIKSAWEELKGSSTMRFAN